MTIVHPDPDLELIADKIRERIDIPDYAITHRTLIYLVLTVLLEIAHDSNLKDLFIKV